ncbi:MAG: ATP-dependent DNA helicase RecG [Ruminococcaceae bacterium]|nr:ATP-dependent DNA helicase RecG [Oscillospiraceae bacterium]
MDISTDIRYLKGVGEKRAELFSKLGINSLGDILEYYPRMYEDWSKAKKISETVVGETSCVKGFITHTPTKALIKKGMTIYKTGVCDGEEVMDLTIFNNRFAAEALKEGEEYVFFGKVGGNLYKREMTNPAFSVAEGGERIRPIYSSSQALSTKIIEKTVRTAIDNIKETLNETLPDRIRSEYKLASLIFSLENVHFPQSEKNLEVARRRLIFEELFILQLGLLLLRSRSKKITTNRIEFDKTEEFCSFLPFTMTGAQSRAVREAVEDMKKDVPMNRLVQGDVGSGKTAVAAAIIYNAAKNGFQSALMAPTEILATQHYHTLEKFFENTDINVALLTGSVRKKQKDEIKEKLKNGEIDLLVGTHAIIQDDVEFYNLGLAVTDEQHRFGVAQRGSLSKKGEEPHLLVMSATPIPRTLALMIYGDLDVSILDELPPGRQKIDTFYVDYEKHERAMNYVKKHLDRGLQGYIVCPLVESEESELVSATQIYENFKNNEFKNYTVGLLHGKMKPKEKDEVMKKFADGETQLLIATTVIEVGVDVPNAVIMVIENAEMFGLSQLHQLRGRVGRGKEKSTCILVSDAQNDDAKTRLNVMCKTSDGFKIADEDLKLRGPGDFFGSRQHGLPKMKIANLLNDMKTLKEAQAEAKKVLADDPRLRKKENEFLRKAVINLYEKMKD